jgi:hypothetical protein
MPGLLTYVISRLSDGATGSGSHPRSGGPINLLVGPSECVGQGDHGRHHTPGSSCGGREGCVSARTGWGVRGRGGGRGSSRDGASSGIWIGRDSYG